MAFKAKLPLLLFFFGFFLLSFTSSLAYEKDPEQQLQQCTNLCEKQEKFRDYCKLKCGKEYVKREKEQERRGEGGSTGRDVFNTTNPQKESGECQYRCELLRLPHQKIQQCKERCEEKRREQERQEQRGGGGSDIYNEDPQREYQQCMRRCQQQEGGSQQQRQCQKRCEEILGEQEREEQRDGDNNVDPQREYQQCMRRCKQQGGSQLQRQCQQRCEEILREQEREERRGGDNNADPRREYQQCMRRCQQQEGGSQQQRRQCQKRCEEILGEQEREERHGGDNNADPQREYQQCMRRCQQQEGGSQQQRQCQKRCEEIQGEQEREEQRDGDNNVDPQREYQQCMRRCQQQEGGSQQQRQCQKRCEEILGEQEREERHGGYNNADPQREYQQCMRRYQQQEGGSQQQRQCQKRCEEILGEQEREKRRSGDNNAYPQREYQQCMRRCQQQGGSQQQRQCQQRCEEILGEQEREERLSTNADPQREYQQCMRRCQQQEGGSQLQRQCQQRCEEILREHEREERRGGDNNADPQSKNDNNPYFFDEQSFIEKYRTEEGRIRVLPKFTQRSNLHRGIENYRLAIFEANPNTFVIPNHRDADAVIYVVKGRGTISMIGKEKRDSFNLERGDVIRVPSGSVVYMVNRDNNEQLQIAKLDHPISKTGHVHEFFSVGAEEPESFYKVFSNEVLEAAFNTPIKRLETLFGQQKKGVIIKASKEQVQALSKQASRGAYNIFNKRPKYLNKHGELYEVKPNDYKQLQDLDIAVSFVNITKGAMMAPYYNTRATKLILAVEGSGRFEMACPSGGEQEQEQEQGGTHYQRVGANLSPKTMFIVPTGHPVTIIASDNENLQLVEFTISAQDSERNFLAGKENVLNQMEIEAIELGFNIPSREVQEIYNRQKEFVFVPAPNQRQQQREREIHGLSILEIE